MSEATTAQMLADVRLLLENAASVNSAVGLLFRHIEDPTWSGDEKIIASMSAISGMLEYLEDRYRVGLSTRLPDSVMQTVGLGSLRAHAKYLINETSKAMKRNLKTHPGAEGAYRWWKRPSQVAQYAQQQDNATWSSLTAEDQTVFSTEVALAALKETNSDGFAFDNIALRRNEEDSSEDSFVTVDRALESNYQTDH